MTLLTCLNGTDAVILNAYRDTMLRGRKCYGSAQILVPHWYLNLDEEGPVPFSILFAGVGGSYLGLGCFALAEVLERHKTRRVGGAF